MVFMTRHNNHESYLSKDIPSITLRYEFTGDGHVSSPSSAHIVFLVHAASHNHAWLKLVSCKLLWLLHISLA